jgi:NADPH:quinone reductase-like Zn-dependent oxidoreductase
LIFRHLRLSDDDGAHFHPGECPIRQGIARVLREVMKGMEEGAFRPIVDMEVPFAEARRAHERLQDRANFFGKGVLVP